MASSSQQAPVEVESGKGFHIKLRIMKFIKNELTLILEQIVDFESYSVNGYPLREYFEVQGWMFYFEMPNEPTYPYLVKDF